jgi:hypothetical protein
MFVILKSTRIQRIDYFEGSFDEIGRKEGRLPRGIGIERLRDLPTEWSQQFEALGRSPNAG